MESIHNAPPTAVAARHFEDLARPSDALFGTAVTNYSKHDNVT